MKSKIFIDGDFLNMVQKGKNEMLRNRNTTDNSTNGHVQNGTPTNQRRSPKKLGGVLKRKFRKNTKFKNIRLNLFTASRIDQLCRIFYPIAFFGFVASFWIVYKPQL